MKMILLQTQILIGSIDLDTISTPYGLVNEVS